MKKFLAIFIVIVLSFSAVACSDVIDVITSKTNGSENVFLAARDKGNCRTLKGDVVVSVVFVDDSLSLWSQEEMDEFKALRTKDEEILEREAQSYGAELDLTVTYVTGKVDVNFDRDNTNPWKNAVLEELKYSDPDKAIAELKKQHSSDEATFIFARNAGGRSFAEQAVSDSGFECAFLYGDGGFRHELLHIFGAEDFYYPEEVMNFAMESFPDTVMLASKEEAVDSFSAYLVGWIKEPDEKGKAFIEFTHSMTAEYLQEEHKKEVFTGNGRKTYVNGTYEGGLVDGVMHGNGTYTWTSGDTYTGEYLFGKMHGTGTMVWKEGDTYTGDFVDDKRTGKGVYTWPDGDTYTGDFIDGERTGNGTFTWASGDTYTGDFVDGERTGTGTYTWAEGDTYTGDFVKDERTGKGTYTWVEGDIYIGDFVDGKRTGYGVMTWTNGDKYEGEFLDGKRHGQGTYYYAKSNRTQSGTWANGKLVK